MTLAGEKVIERRDGRLFKELQPSMPQIVFEERPDGKGQGIMLDFGEYAVLVTLETAEWIAEALGDHIESARRAESS